MVKMCCYCCSRIILCVFSCMYCVQNPSVVETTELPPCNCLLRFLSCVCVFFSVDFYWIRFEFQCFVFGWHIQRRIDRTRETHQQADKQTSPTLETRHSNKHATTRDNIESVSMLLYQYWYTFTWFNIHTHGYQRFQSLFIYISYYVTMCYIIVLLADYTAALLELVFVVVVVALDDMSNDGRCSFTSPKWIFDAFYYYFYSFSFVDDTIDG